MHRTSRHHQWARGECREEYQAITDLLLPVGGVHQCRLGGCDPQTPNPRHVSKQTPTPWEVARVCQSFQHHHRHHHHHHNNNNNNNNTMLTFNANSGQRSTYVVGLGLLLVPCCFYLHRCGCKTWVLCMCTWGIVITNNIKTHLIIIPQHLTKPLVFCHTLGTVACSIAHIHAPACVVCQS